MASHGPLTRASARRCCRSSPRVSSPRGWATTSSRASPHPGPSLRGSSVGSLVTLSPAMHPSRHSEHRQRCVSGRCNDIQVALAPPAMSKHLPLGSAWPATPLTVPLSSAPAPTLGALCGSVRLDWLSSPVLPRRNRHPPPPSPPSPPPLTSSRGGSYRSPTATARAALTAFERTLHLPLAWRRPAFGVAFDSCFDPRRRAASLPGRPTTNTSSSATSEARVRAQAPPPRAR